MTDIKSAKALVEGKKVVVSGTFCSFPRRATLETVIRWFGGKVTTSISKSTDYLIAGDAVGPAKLAQCKELDIPVVSEEEFVKLMLNDTVVIPDDVVEIADGAFERCHGLKHVVIPESVTKIGNSFSECTELETVELPKSVTCINWQCFYFCPKLKGIKVDPENPVYSSYNGILLCGEYVFICPESLPVEKVDLPEGITYVGGFSKNKFIKEVNIPDGVERIGDGAFSNCCNLEKVSLPDSVEIIDQWAFGATGITSITIPEEVNVIKSNTFWSCKSLKSVKLPSSLETIESKAFEKCVALEELEIPDSVEKIESGAFNYCASLKHVRLPKSLKDLGTSAFSSCNIKSVELPKEFKPWNDDIRKYSGFENCEEVITY